MEDSIVAITLRGIHIIHVALSENGAEVRTRRTTIDWPPGIQIEDFANAYSLLSAFIVPTSMGYYLAIKIPTKSTYDFFKLPIATYGTVDK